MVVTEGSISIEFQYVANQYDEDEPPFDNFTFFVYFWSSLKITVAERIVFDTSEFGLPLGELAARSYHWVKKEGIFYDQAVERSGSDPDFNCQSFEDLGLFLWVRKIDGNWYLGSDSIKEVVPTIVNIDDVKVVLFKFAEAYRDHMFELFHVDILPLLRSGFPDGQLHRVEDIEEFS